MTRPTATLIFVVVTAVAVAAVATATAGRKRRGLEVEAGGLTEFAINGVLSSGGCDDTDFEILHNFYVMCMSYGLYSRPSCLVPAANQSSINVGRTWPQQAYSTVKLLDTIASVGTVYQACVCVCSCCLAELVVQYGITAGRWLPTAALDGEISCAVYWLSDHS